MEFNASRALWKDRAYFGEKKIETGAVDLLIIRLYLGKIGIVRKIEREIICNPIFNIESGIQRGIIHSCITRLICIEGVNLIEATKKVGGQMNRAAAVNSFKYHPLS